MNGVKRIVTITLMTCAAAVSAPAQTPDTSTACTMVELRTESLSGARAGLARALSIFNHQRGTESRLLRHGADPERICVSKGQQFVPLFDSLSTRRSWAMLPVAATAHYNSAYARTVNDGAAWNGAGWTGAVSAGITGSWRFLTASAEPLYVHSRNVHFATTHSTLPARSEFANAYHPNIDLPERFGTDPVESFDPGQSFIDARGKGLYARVSNENVWVGAAEVYPVVMSNTAPGFAHIALGTSRPLRTSLVDIEFHVMMGKLDESEYFDGDNDNDEHVYTVGLIVLQPRMLEGLSLGIARAYHDSLTPGTGPERYLKELFRGPFLRSSGVAAGNSIGALYARWVLPSSGFEAYVEWSREDAFGDIDDLLREPDWTQGYVLGFQKVGMTQNRLLRLYGELIHLGASAPERGGRGQTAYYTHGKIQQGHTHEGQLLGAAIGPGADAQLLGLDMFHVTNWSRIKLERVRYDADTYYNRFSRRLGPTGHDLELTLSGSHGRRFGSFEAEAVIDASRRYNRDFISLTDENTPDAETNIGVSINLRWLPRW